MPGIIAILLVFFSLIREHGKHFQKSINNLLPLSVSVECLDTGIAKNDLVGLEAILNITDKKWSTLYFCVFLVFLLYCIEIFILIIQTLLEFRNKLLFNQFVEPRENAKHTGGDIHILFCHEGILGPGEVFQPNHKFVVAGHALGHTFGHALPFLFDYPFKNPRSAPEIFN